MLGWTFKLLAAVRWTAAGNSTLNTTAIGGTANCRVRIKREGETIRIDGKVFTICEMIGAICPIDTPCTGTGGNIASVDGHRCRNSVYPPSLTLAVDELLVEVALLVGSNQFGIGAGSRIGRHLSTHRVGCSHALVSLVRPNRPVGDVAIVVTPTDEDAAGRTDVISTHITGAVVVRGAGFSLVARVTNGTTTVDVGLIAIEDVVFAGRRLTYIICTHAAYTIRIGRASQTITARIANGTATIGACLVSILNSIDAGGGLTDIVGAHAADAVAIGSTG